MDRSSKQHGHDAPEVAPENSLMMPSNNEMDGPEAIHFHYHSHYGQTPAYQPVHQTSSPSEKQHGQPWATTYALSDSSRPQQASKPRRRKRWLWIGLGIGALIMAVVVGVGVGVSVSNRRSDDKVVKNGIGNGSGDSSNTSTSSPAATMTTSSTVSTTASATRSAVTSGTTGIAAFSCNSTEPVTISTGTTYLQECATQYQVGHPSFYNTSVEMVNLPGKWIRYSFEDCLAACDKYNEDPNHQPQCRAVTYYANMTFPISAWGGNCFLKNDRGHGYNTDLVDYTLTASAYQSCLNETCFGSN